MTIRRYNAEDLSAIASLFRGAVYGACAFYTREQLNAWASADVSSWAGSLLQNDARVAEEDGEIVGFADMTADGYLDRLYVRKDFFRRGVGNALCDALENACSKSCFRVYASAMAKPFFEKRGYVCLHDNIAVRQGVAIRNYYMEKNCGDHTKIRELGGNENEI